MGLDAIVTGLSYLWWLCMHKGIGISGEPFEVAVFRYVAYVCVFISSLHASVGVTCF